MVHYLPFLRLEGDHALIDHEYDSNNYIVDCRFMLYVHCETNRRMVLGRHTVIVRSREISRPVG
jgi:hypothetical protein